MAAATAVPYRNMKEYLEYIRRTEPEIYREAFELLRKQGATAPAMNGLGELGFITAALSAVSAIGGLFKKKKKKAPPPPPPDANANKPIELPKPAMPLWGWLAIGGAGLAVLGLLLFRKR